MVKVQLNSTFKKNVQFPHRNDRLKLGIKRRVLRCKETWMVLTSCKDII